MKNALSNSYQSLSLLIDCLEMKNSNYSTEFKTRSLGGNYLFHSNKVEYQVKHNEFKI